MSVVTLTFYEGDDPPAGGTPVGTLTDADLEGFSLRRVLSTKGIHSAEVIVNRNDATAALLVAGRWMTVDVPVLDASDPILAVRLGPARTVVLSEDEEGGEYLQIGGLGVLSQFQRARLLEEVYAPGQPCRGSCPSLDGSWSWRANLAVPIRYGGIMVRGIEEGQNQPGAPLEHVTITFDRVQNSAGVNWPEITAEFQQPIGTDVGELHDRIAEGGQLFLREHADLSVDGFSAYGQGTFGVDRTTASFATGKVLLTVDPDTASNLVTGLEEEGEDEPYTHVIVEGAGGVYVTRVSPDYSSGPGRWGFVSYGDSDDTDLLEDVGDEFLARSTSRATARELEIVPGDAELQGEYLPVKHFAEGDLVSLDVPGLQADVRIVAWRLQLAEAVSDATAEDAARSLHVVVELDAVTSEDGTDEPAATGGTGGTGPGRCCVELCRAGTSARPVVDGEVYYGNAASVSSEPVQITDAADRVLYVLIHAIQGTVSGVEWFPEFVGSGDTGPDYALQKLDSVTTGNGTEVSLWRLEDPVASTTPTSIIRVTNNADGHTVAVFPVYAAGEDLETDIATAVGSGNDASVAVGAGANDLVLDMVAWHQFPSPGTATPDATAGQTEVGASTSTSAAYGGEATGAGYGTAATPTWDLNQTPTEWAALGVAIAGTGTPGDGHAELVNPDGKRASRCGHRHDLHRTVPPTANDDETLGIPVGTVWAVLDDLEAPTELTAVYILADASEGAAVWLEFPVGLSQAEVEALLAALAASDLTTYMEPHVAYDGTVVLDGNGDPVMVEVAF